jgi:hypothetical protein
MSTTDKVLFSLSKSMKKQFQLHQRNESSAVGSVHTHNESSVPRHHHRMSIRSANLMALGNAFRSKIASFDRRKSMTRHDKTDSISPEKGGGSAISNMMKLL